MSDTDPPTLADHQFYARALIEPMLKELRAQSGLQRQMVDVLRDLHEELAYLRKTSDRLARLEHLLNAARAGGT